MRYGFESQPWHLCPWVRHLTIIASLHPGKCVSEWHGSCDWSSFGSSGFVIPNVFIYIFFSVMERAFIITDHIRRHRAKSSRLRKISWLKTNLKYKWWRSWLRLRDLICSGGTFKWGSYIFFRLFNIFVNGYVHFVRLLDRLQLYFTFNGNRFFFLYCIVLSFQK